MNQTNQIIFLLLFLFFRQNNMWISLPIMLTFTSGNTTRHLIFRLFPILPKFMYLLSVFKGDLYLKFIVLLLKGRAMYILTSRKWEYEIHFEFQYFTFHLHFIIIGVLLHHTFNSPSFCTAYLLL